jgi:hypothetical protein
VGDVAGLMVGPLVSIAKARKGCSAAKKIFLTGAGIEGAIGGVKLGQGVLALASGNFDEALAYLGEATLRLLGMSRDLYQRLKASCFPAGTPVATADGLRAIETIRPDEQVWGLDLATGLWQLCRVLEAHRRAYAGPFVAIALGLDTIESTSNHPYWVVRGEGLAERPWPGDVPLSAVIPSIPGRWVEACNLRIGDVLLLKPDRQAAVTGLSVRWVQQEVYNLHIEEVQSYAAGTAQVLVHNTNYAPNKIPRVGQSHPDLPVRKNPNDPTHGIFNDKQKLVSGTSREAEEVFKARMGQLSEKGKIALKHVEGQAAAEMVKNNLKEGVLHINYKTGPCPNCVPGVPELLGEGQKLWVVFPDGVGYFTNKGWFPL